MVMPGMTAAFSLNAAVIPGITMVGTAPTFYKIAVTRALVEAVQREQFPAQRTFVQKFEPPVRDPANYCRDGMWPIHNRSLILACFEAFRQFL